MRQKPINLYSILIRFGLAWLLGLAAFSAHAGEPIESMTLPNGMQIVVIPNHKVPAVSHIIWFRVGAIDDPKGKSGLAHYHEHMMFQGTPKYPADTLSTLARRLGGEKNAFTNRDFTAYMINIAKEHLGKAMELEADRMMNLDPPQAFFDREKKVIIEERKMSIESKPQRLLGEQMDAMLYRNHPYGTPVIGWLHEMEGLTREDVMKLHREYYKPRNAYVVITGDVTMKEVKPLALKYYGKLPAGPKTTRTFTQEPPQNAERMVVFRHPEVEKPEWNRIYAAPSVNMGDKTLVMPLEVLSYVLGGGSNSRLYRSLVVKQKIATSVSASYEGYALGGGEFSLYAVPVKGVSMERLERAITAEMDRLKKEPVTAEELETAKTLYAANMVYAREGLEGMNYMVGSLMAVGLPPDYPTRSTEEIRKVTPQQVMMAAEQVLVNERSVTGWLLPEKEGKAP